MEGGARPPPIGTLGAHAHTCRPSTLALHPGFFPGEQVSHGQKKLFGSWFRDEAGASPSWLFVAPTDKTRKRKAIVKVACIPVGKHAANRHPVCHADIAAKYAKIYLAIEKLAEECGLTGAWVHGGVAGTCMGGGCLHANAFDWSSIGVARATPVISPSLPPSLPCLCTTP